MRLNPHIFRAYDVRGRVGTDITPRVFHQVCQAFGSLVRGRGGERIASVRITASRRRN
jgi:phosphomannomutase / phosphoglucomutase